MLNRNYLEGRGGSGGEGSRGGKGSWGSEEEAGGGGNGVMEEEKNLVAEDKNDSNTYNIDKEGGRGGGCDVNLLLLDTPTTYQYALLPHTC